jgi:hypothetical protein
LSSFEAELVAAVALAAVAELAAETVAELAAETETAAEIAALCNNCSLF